MFPLLVKYNKEIELNNPEKQTTNGILVCFAEKLAKKKADNIKVEEHRLTFKNNLLRLTSNWNIMLPVDYGEITIKNNSSNKIKIRYTISLRRILLIVAIISFIIYGSSKSLNNGLIAFGWLGGMNWIIAVIRHRILFNNLIYDIQEWK